MLTDLRFSWRALCRQRAFTLVTVLTLALGLGSAAAIFSVADWVLFQAQPFPGDLYLVGGTSEGVPFSPFRMEFVARAYAEQTNVMAEWTKASFGTGNIVANGTPIATGWVNVSPDFFRVLGVQPALGRGFLPAEDAPGSDQVIVVSHRFWKEHLGGGPEVIGRKLQVGDAICTIIGVLRENQTLPAYLWNDVYRPLAYRVDPKEPWLPMLTLIGRLRPGITRAEATRALDAVKVPTPDAMRGWQQNDHAALTSLQEVNRLFRPDIYWIMVGAVGCLYAIACLNVSNLLLVRMLGRRRELSIRLALGGGRRRILRLLLIECGIVALAGALAGTLVANWLFPLLLNAAGNAQAAPDWTRWTLGGRTLVMLAGCAGATCLLIALVPAIRLLRADVNDGLKDGGAALGESPTLARLRGAFVVTQAAFALVLLAGAGLMIRTFHQFQRIDLGFEPAHRIKVRLGFPNDYPHESTAFLQRLREIQTLFQHQPGVVAAGFGDDVLLPGYSYPSQTLAGPHGSQVRAAMMGFNIGYQQAAGIRLVRGRWLNQTMGNEVLVNEALARACWPGEEPVGQLLRPVDGNPSAGPDWKGWQVVGVVHDIRATMRDEPAPMIYSPEGWGSTHFWTFVLRLSTDDTGAVGTALRRALYAAQPRVVIHQIVPLNELRDQQLWAERMTNAVLKVLAGIALLLTLVGVFSVLAYTVDRRRGEFGVRLALGATPADLVRLVLRRGLILTALGAALGIASALALHRSLQSLVFGVSAQDTLTLAVVTALLLVTAGAACLVPARRAARTKVARLLRSE